jgi:ferredoxin/flavodoxin---NADP+ reductase
MHVAVVGSGPAGIYRVDDLVRRADLDVAVDILEQLPLLYGLVRYDVAPDHPPIKAIIGSSQRSLEHPQVRFVGSVDVGRDVTRRQLAESYDGAFGDLLDACRGAGYSSSTPPASTIRPRRIDGGRMAC